MAILKTVTAAQKLIRDTLSKRDKQAEYAQNMISQAEENINEIDRRMEEIAKDGDPAEYKKAKQEMEDAQDIKEMYKRKYNAFIQEPLIEKHDYKRITSEILAEYDALQLESKKSLAKLAEEMKSISDHLNTAANEANKALKAIQHDLFHDGDRMKHPKTGACFANDEKSIRDYTAIMWGKSAVENLTYVDFIRNREENEQ